MAGKQLLKTLAEGTGLPQDPVLDEIKSLAKKLGKEEHLLTLDDLRVILEEYLQETILEAKKKFSEPR